MELRGVNIIGGVNITTALSYVTSGLVIDLDAGNPASYPGTGTSWTNLVNSSTYTINNGSYSNGSIVFNGTSTYVALGTPLANNTNFTKESWVYASVLAASRNIISSQSNPFWTNLSTLSAGVGSSFSLVTSSSFPTGVWRQVVQTFDDTANTMKLYINGSQVNQNLSVTQHYVSEVERIGAHFSGGSPVSFWSGNISIARIYDRALSAIEVSQNYDAVKSRYGL